MTIQESIVEMATESDSTIIGWPYPPMYQFLIDDFRTHLTNAENAFGARDHVTYLAELEKARIALRDFKCLSNEFKRDKGR